MHLFGKYFLFFITLFLTLNNLELFGMKRSEVINFEIYNKTETKTNAIAFLDLWISVYLGIVDLELRDWVAEQMDILKNSAGSNMREINGLIRRWEGPEIKELIECCWDYGLNNKYGVYGSDFIGTLKNEHQIDEESLEIIEQQKLYTLGQLLEIIVSKFLQDLNLDMTKEKFISLTKQILVTFILQKFVEGDEQLSWCNCEHVSIGERVVMLIMTLERLNRNFDRENCTEENPLVYTSFGSGALLYDYIAIYILSTFGYNYFKLNFIDICYNLNEYFDYKKKVEGPFIFQLGFCEGNFIINFFGQIDTYLNSLPDKNHILSTIDTLHFNNSKSQFKKLIKKTTGANTVVGSLAEHVMCYSFIAQNKHSLNS